MNLFSLSFKDDKELEKVLNSGNIKENTFSNNKETEENTNINDNNDNEKISMGIRDSDVYTNIDKENEKEEKDDQKELIKEEKIEESERHNSMVLNNKRSLFHKIFGPMEAGSIRGSIFNMVILSLGTGMFALPKYMSNTSLFLSCFLIIGICITVWWSLLLLSKSCEKNKIFNYSKLIELLYGKILSLIYDIIVILYSFGVLILFNCIIFSNLGEALYGIYFYKNHKTLQEFLNDSFWNEWYIKILLPYASSIIIVYPMCLIKDVSKLRIISLIGVINIIGLIVIIIYQSKDYINKDNIDNNINYFDIKKGFQGEFDTLNFISCIFYASCFHIGCVPVINTLTNNVQRRIEKAIRRTILIDVFFYLVIAIVGYLSCPVDTPSLIIQRPTLKPHDSDIIMGIGKIGFVFTFFTKLPNTYSSLRINNNLCYLFNFIFRDFKLYKNYGRIILYFSWIFVSITFNYKI